MSMADEYRPCRMCGRPIPAAVETAASMTWKPMRCFRNAGSAGKSPTTARSWAITASTATTGFRISSAGQRDLLRQPDLCGGSAKREGLMPNINDAFPSNYLKASDLKVMKCSSRLTAWSSKPSAASAR
jgi:hypothetical protein